MAKMQRVNAISARLVLLTVLIGASALTAFAHLPVPDAFSSDVDYLRRKFREDVTDASTGLGLQALKANAWNMLATLKDREAWCLVKAHLFEMICDRMSIGVSAHDSWGNPGLALVSSWIADKESAGTVP